MDEIGELFVLRDQGVIAQAHHSAKVAVVQSHTGEAGDNRTDTALGQFVVDLIGFCYQGKMPETIEVTMIKEDLWKIDSFETTRPALFTVRVLSG